MFNSNEKISNMFTFSINCLNVINDVLLCELRLKQVSIIKSHALYHPTVERLINFVGKKLKSSYLSEAALTLVWDYNGFSLNLKRLYAQNITSQMVVLANRIREIAYRGSEKKTLTRNATIKFKLGNPVRTYIIINSLNSLRSLYLNKVFFLANKKHGCRGQDQDQSKLGVAS